MTPRRAARPTGPHSLRGEVSLEGYEHGSQIKGREKHILERGGSNARREVKQHGSFEYHH